ncbi:hypothetical protein ABFS82_10G038100 [Erythranthe guttata]|uniref:PTM/DIR17-like Tudor domain-containing protein n=1 Tax=Erythranthe guttata TaxID=4155 RepID=A0A022RMF2_ERYGU|nr:PREDICTED: dirigent protein 17-like [Erythranthe guttata]EYU41657.1 hypothetical protein MIMGU_mgv1a015123mg [Erythranthe guttata]|eukprot:XP_012831953.1 PREDICTED: dirigent protein 17-like [Erythranthe guttata]
MENKNNEDLMDYSMTEIFEISGEPAIVINGLPPPLSSSSSETNLIHCAVSDSKPQNIPGFGEWMEGREVRKSFGEEFFNGKVTQFDEEEGWYRVVYEDGDFEDLEWQELMEVLVPLDVNIPLKTLAMKIIKKRQKSSVQKSAKNKVRSRNDGSFDGKGKGKESDVSL